MSFIQDLAVTAVSFLLVLGLVVTIHELGHFLVARALGTKIDQFSIGFGRALATWNDRQGVQWRLGWIPIGGYVRFAGDENMASIPDAEELSAMRRDLVAREGVGALSRYFHFKPIWQRALIVAAGPTANFLLAIAIFAAMAMAFGQQTKPFRVEKVSAGTPAAAAGFRVGDVIVGVQGRELHDIEAIRQAIQVRGGVPTTFQVERGGQRLSFVATPRWETQKTPLGGNQRVGVVGVLPDGDTEVIRIRYGLFAAVQVGAVQTWDVLSTSVYYLGRMIAGQVSTDQLRGPLGIAEVTNKVAQLGAHGAQSIPAMLAGAGINLLQLAAVISVSIGFMNLLPVPVLDGGHLLFYAYEAVARRPLAAKVQAAGFRVGLALVFGLMLFATWNDLQRLHVFNLFSRLVS